MSSTKHNSDGRTDITQASGSTTYQCPHCDVQYDNEILTRVHISRSEDRAHINRHGFMPETTITGVDAQGNTVDTESTAPSDIDVTSLSLTDITGDYTDQHKCIILAGAYNYESENYRELETAATDVLEAHGEEVPSYSTIRRVLREFYRPQEVAAEEKRKAESDNTTDEQLRDLTPKQQAILIAKVANPDETDTRIAERAGGVSTPYPRKVYSERAPDVYTDLQQAVADGTDIAEVLREELSVEALDELHKRGFELGVDLTEFTTDANSQDEDAVIDRGVDEQRGVMSANPHTLSETETMSDKMAADTTQNTTTDESAGASVASATEPTNEPPVESETPDSDTARTSSTTASPAVSDEHCHADTRETDATSQSNQYDETETVSDGTHGEISRSEVADLHEKVSWFVEIKQGVETDSACQSELAFAEHIETELETLLN